MAVGLGISGAPSTLQPDQFASEAEKFANGGLWFGQYARWIAWNFYNYNIRTVFPQSAYNYYFATDVLENFSYYYGEQRNQIFAYAAQLPSGGNIPAPFIAGQQIRNFVDNMNGNVTQMVKPMGDSISCKNMDYESILDKAVKYNVARMAVKAKPMLDALAQRGVQFNPSDKAYMNESEVDEDEESEIDQYEEAGIKITRSIYYDQDLEDQFTSQDGLHQFVGGISGTIIERKGDKVCHRHVPSFNCIYDYRSKDSWGKDALIGGAVILMTAEEIALECPDLTHEELEQIRYMAISGNQDANVFRQNINAGWNNIRWFGNDGRIAVVKAYWVVRRDLRNYRTTNSLGQTTVKFYDDNKTYQTNIKNDNGGFKHEKGSQLKGENWTWDVATCYLIGNHWTTGYGYCDYVVKDTYGFPKLPFQFFSHNLVNGYSKSIVSRLKPLEGEYDRIMLHIREMMGRDYGKFFILNGKKIGIDDAIQVLTDVKTSGMYVSAGDQNYMSQDGEKMIEVVDGSLGNIQPYIQMLEVLRREMMQTVSISDVALGMQESTIGAKVQQTTIASSSLANLPIYQGLKTFWENKMQYSLELAKMFIKEGAYAVAVDKNQVEILNVTKDVLSKNLGVYFKLSDELNDENKKFLRDFLFSLAQNAPIMAQFGLDVENVLDLVTSYNFESGRKDLKRTIAINKQKNAEQQAQNTQAEAQAQQQAIQTQKAYDAMIAQFKEENANWRNVNDNEVKAMGMKMDKVMEFLQLMQQQQQPQLQSGQAQQTQQTAA